MCVSFRDTIPLGCFFFFKALHFLSWMKQEPQSMVWLPVLHRYSIQCILHTKICGKRQHSGFESTPQMHFFARARGCWPLLRLCRSFMIFERCLHSVPKIWKKIFPEMKLCCLIPNFYIHGSVSDLYVPWSVRKPDTTSKGDRWWGYINRLQMHECRNWEWGCAVSFPGIFFSIFLCRVQASFKNHKWAI